MRVLYIEDDPLDADLTRRELRKVAPYIELEIVASLGEASARLDESPKSYDLVLTDMSLRDGDGLALLTHVRKHSLPVAVVLITGSGDEEIAVAALKAGADDYLVKSADYRTRLPQTLEGALERYRVESARLARPLRVLYAEDNALDIDLTRRHLARHAPNIHLDVVNTADEVLARIRGVGGDYDVLMLDYRLPGCNALELLKELKRIKELDVPVLLVTGQGSEDIAVQALRVGAADYLVKTTDYLHRLPSALENAFHRAQLAREQAALRASEERYRLISELTSDFMYAMRVEPDGTFVSEWATGIFSRLTGYHWDEFLKNTEWTTLIHPDDLPILLRHGQTLLAGQSDAAEFRLTTQDGKVYWALNYGKPVWDEKQKRVVRIVGAARDVTAHKLSELQLRLQSSALEAAANGIIISGLDGIILWANPAFACLTGYPPEEAIGKSTNLLKSGQHDRAFYRNMWNTIRSGEVWHGEVVNRRKDGGLYTEEMTITPVRAGGDDITHFIAIKQDVTERKQAEEEIRNLNRGLARHAQELDALNQAARAVTATLNMDQVLQSVIAQVRSLFNVEGASVLLRDPIGDELCFAASTGARAESLSGIRMPATSGIAGWAVREREPIIVNDAQDDPRFYDQVDVTTGLTTHSVLAVPLISKGIVWGVIEAMNKASGDFDRHDLELMQALASSAAIAIENARLYTSLAETNTQLQEALRAKDEMLQNVSHELRTPLSLIYGYIELLQMGELGQTTPEQERVLQTMHRQGDRLRFMVDRLIAMQMFDPNKLKRVEMDMGLWLQQTLQSWEARASRSGIHLETELADSAIQIFADPVSLGQVIENLVDNAVKFSSRGGGIKIRAWTDKGMAMVAVSDQGIGIPPDKLQQIFDRFYQVDGSATRHFGGIGIGLALCRAIIEAHEGKIWAESPGVNQGSTFYFTLPTPRLGD